MVNLTQFANISFKETVVLEQFIRSLDPDYKIHSIGLWHEESEPHNKKGYMLIGKNCLIYVKENKGQFNLIKIQFIFNLQ